MRVFISHSSGRSFEFAKYLYEWVQDSPLGLTPWASFSNSDLPAGPDDYNNIINSARLSDACISVLTRENLDRPWINFEAGLFYGNNKKPVFAVLCGDLSHTELKSKNHPLANINCTYIKNESLLRMLTTINSGISPQKDEKTLNRFICADRTSDLKEKHDEIFLGGTDDNLDSLAVLTKI